MIGMPTPTVSPESGVMLLICRMRAAPLVVKCVTSVVATPWLFRAMAVTVYEVAGFSPHRVDQLVLPGPYCPVTAEWPDATVTRVSVPLDAVICTWVSGATRAAPSAGVTVRTAGGAGLAVAATRCTTVCSAGTGAFVATYPIPPASTSPAAPATSHRSFRTAGLAIHEGPRE